MNKLKKELWRLRINWVLSSFLVSVLYVGTAKDVFASLHRFVTNPTMEDMIQANKTVQVSSINIL